MTLCFAVVILSTLCCQYARIIPLLIFAFPSLCHQAKLFFYFPALKIKWSSLLTSSASNHMCPKLLKPSHPVCPLGLPSISALQFPHLLLNLVYDSKFCSGTRTRTPWVFYFPLEFVFCITSSTSRGMFPLKIRIIKLKGDM